MHRYLAVNFYVLFFVAACFSFGTSGRTYVSSFRFADRTDATKQKKKARSRQLLWDKGETAKKGRGALAAARVRLDESRTLVPFDELCVQSHSVAV